jgi:hypothetical protein
VKLKRKKANIFRLKFKYKIQGEIKMRKIFIVFIIFIAAVCVATESRQEISKDINESLNVVAKCGPSESCVRFCCDDIRSCGDENSFNLSSVKEAKDLDSTFKLLLGKPKCDDDEKLYKVNSSWKLMRNGEAHYSLGGISEIIGHDKYCLDIRRDSRFLYCYEPSFTQKYYVICKNFPM